MTIKQDFTANTLEENTDVYANYLPGGRLYSAKYIDDSVLRNLLKGLAGETTRLQQKVQELSEEHDILKTTNLIEEWERALGIPDSCVEDPTKWTIDERRKYVRAKLALMKVTTKQDFIDLAFFLGFAINVIPGEINEAVFTFTFPITLFSDAKHARFTMIVVFTEIPQPASVFSWKFPVKFSENKEDFLTCVIRKLAPANVSVLFRYEL